MVPINDKYDSVWGHDLAVILHRIQTLRDSKDVLMSSRAVRIGESEFSSEVSQVVLSTIDSLSCE